MALPVVTAAELKARYPVFATVPDALVDLVLGDGARAVSEDWIAADQKPAILAYAAHMLAAEGYEARVVGVDGGEVSVIGPVETVKIGDAMVKLATDKSGAGAGGGAAADDLTSTAYGRYYLTLLHRSQPAVVVV